MRTKLPATLYSASDRSSRNGSITAERVRPEMTSDR